MIYENFEMSYEKLVFQTGFSASSNHRHSTIQDVLNDIESFWHISNFTLPTAMTEHCERIEKIMKDLLEHYSKKNFALDEVYLFNIQDKEFFDIVELTHNFLIPLFIKFLVIENISKKCLSTSIYPAIVAAEAKILLAKEKIFSGNTIKINSMDYKFTNFLFRNTVGDIDKSSKQTEEQSITSFSKLKNISSFKKANIEASVEKSNETSKSRGRKKPRGPQEIILNKIEN